MKFAIPSHRRRQVLESKTLVTLRNNGIPESSIYIFVSDEKDFNDYKNLEDKGYKVIFEVELEDIIQKFNFIHRYFPVGTKVVFIEDDIDQLSIKTGKNTLSHFTDLGGLALKLFSQCEEVGTKIWGISSNANPFYMNEKVTSGLVFIVANLFGFISTRDDFLRISHHCKSDYERTLLYFVKYGKVIRANFVCAITKNYKYAGGLQEIKDQRAKLEEEACLYLVRRFPHLIEINEKKSATSMYMELKIKTLRKKDSMTDYMYLQEHYDKEYLKWKLRSEGTLPSK